MRTAHRPDPVPCSGAVAAAPGGAQPAQKIIFDTDFAFPPQDDAMALFFVLNSPELEILGITTVAGNRSLNVATADALKILEVTSRTEIPVYPGRGRAAAAPGHRVGHQAAWRLVRQRAGAGSRPAASRDEEAREPGAPSTSWSAP